MTDFNYSPKELIFDQEGREKLIKGISTIAKAVKSTLGPRGNTVLIESRSHTHGITVTKDGVTVARSIDLLDPVENLAVRMMKEAADRTASMAGDGTTTAIVLTEAIVKNGMDMLKDTHNVSEVIRHMNKITEDVIKLLEKRSKKVSGKTLSDVATISANNDKEIGKIIADVYNKVGKNGIVTANNSQTAETYYEFTNGIKIDRGYTSNLFINDFKKDECIMEDVYVLVSDQEINNILSIERVLRPIINEGKKLLIIAPCSGNVINTLAANVVQNKVKMCNISPPQFGYKQKELMGDIALAVGAKYFSEQTGDDLSLIGMEHLGRAERIIIGRDSSVIVRSEEVSPEMQERIDQLWQAHENTSRKADKDFIKERIASLTGGVGVIYVGGSSDIEQKEKYDRVDDAICAVRSAIEEGILPGGGLALFNISDELSFLADENIEEMSKEQFVAYHIMAKSMQGPLCQIMTNAGLDPWAIMEEHFEGNSYGYDVKNNVYGDMYAMGVIDPLKVTKNALKNAVSVASTILSTNAIITIARA